MVKQISLDSWQIHHLTDLLQKAATIVAKTNSPIILYRQTLEEEDDSYEEIVCTLTKDHILEQVVTSGGVLPPSFHQQLVFPINEFPERLLRKSRDLFLQTVDLLENQVE